MIGLIAAPGRAGATIVGTIFSGPTTADAMSTYWNPAAMTLLSGHSMLAYGGINSIRMQFDRSTPNLFDGSIYPQAELAVPKPELAFGFVSDLGIGKLKNFRAGLLLTIPLLDGGTWDLKTRPPGCDGESCEVFSSTRYFATRARVGHVLIRPAFAYRINRFISVGLGVDVIGVLLKSDSVTDFGAKVNQIACQINADQCQIDAPFKREDPLLQGETTLDGLGWGVGIAGAVLVTPVPWLRLGATIQSGAGDVSVPIELGVQVPPAIAKFIGDNLSSVELPALEATGNVQTVSPIAFMAGISATPTDKLELALDYHWFQKSRMSVLFGQVLQSTTSLISDQASIKAFDDDWQIGARVSYRLLPQLQGAVRLEWDPESRPERFVTPVSIDLDKVHLQLGLAWQALPWLTIIGEYGHYFLFDRQITQSNFVPNADPTTAEEQNFDRPSPLGTYRGFTNRFALAIEASF